MKLPKGFREGHCGDIACPHRDVTCCAPCAGAHEEIVEVGGQHFWVKNDAERAELRNLEAKRKSRQKAG